MEQFKYFLFEICFVQDLISKNLKNRTLFCLQFVKKKKKINNYFPKNLFKKNATQDGNCLKKYSYLFWDHCCLENAYSSIYFILKQLYVNYKVLLLACV